MSSRQIRKNLMIKQIIRDYDILEKVGETWVPVPLKQGRSRRCGL